MSTLVCPKCSYQTENQELFCSKCGTKLIPYTDNSFCESCGARLKPDAEFCTQCGSRRNSYSENNIPELSTSSNQEQVDSHLKEPDCLSSETNKKSSNDQKKPQYSLALRDLAQIADIYFILVSFVMLLCTPAILSSISLQDMTSLKDLYSESYHIQTDNIFASDQTIYQVSHAIFCPTIYDFEQTGRNKVLCGLVPSIGQIHNRPIPSADYNRSSKPSFGQLIIGLLVILILCSIPILIDSAIYALFGNTLSKWAFDFLIIDKSGKKIKAKDYFSRNCAMYSAFVENSSLFNSSNKKTKKESERSRLKRGLETTYDEALGFTFIRKPSPQPIASLKVLVWILSLFLPFIGLIVLALSRTRMINNEQ